MGTMRRSEPEVVESGEKAEHGSGKKGASGTCRGELKTA